ncbi:MAG TPA: FkbM family methyltransferase [Thermoanaerobaculia bacterium]|nr:FkbM family methyltransferase [Thermoanaerobaculia bacterium]
MLSRLIRLPLRLVPKRAVMRVLSGPLRGRRWIAGAATHGCWLGTYERDGQRVFEKHVRPGDVVYDVGANAGFFTLLAAKLAGDGGAVYAFEPLPRNLELLREHVRLNDARNVHVVETAVSDRVGTAHFATAANPAMGGLSDSGGIQVATTTLDALRGSVPPPRFIKMDIEGAESAALGAAAVTLREHRPTILLSAHGFEQYELCSELLRSHGYTLDVLVDGAADGNYVMLARASA